MSADEVVSVWIGGTLDGMEQADPREDVAEYLGRTSICGGVGRPALYRFDDEIVDGRLSIRFVGFVPGRNVE